MDKTTRPPSADGSRLPQGGVVKRLVIGDETSVGLTAGPIEERLVYSNTRGLARVNTGMSLAADDVLITGGETACRLTRFEFMVTGRASPATGGGPFDIDYAFYDICPGAVSSQALPSRLIQGTGGTATFPDEGPYLVSVTIPKDVAVQLPSTVWFSLKFSRNNAGPIVGAPATEGYSQDRYHNPATNPTAVCSANLGGFPQQPHASFYLQVWAEDCPPVHPGYHSQLLTGSVLNPGLNQWLIDDIHLFGSPCRMVGYEVGIRGQGTYSFEFRNFCDGEAIAETERMLTVPAGDTQSRLLRFAVDPPVELADNSWFAGKVTNTIGGLVVTGLPPDIGWTDDSFGVLDHLGHCTIDDRRPTAYDAMHLTVLCEGAAPLGACCDPVLKECQGNDLTGKRCDTDFGCEGNDTCEPVCRELAEYNCWWPPRNSPYLQPHWREGDSCDPDPFGVMCGVFACCKPDYDDACEDLPERECTALEPHERPREWQKGRYCGVGGQRCPFHACTENAQDCNRTWSAPGCDTIDCCIPACDADRWCCAVEWDTVCLRLVSSCGEPLNGTCAGAADLAVGESVEISNRAANRDSPPLSCSGAAPVFGVPGAVWFKFIAPGMPVRIHTCHSDPPSQNTILAVYSVGNPVSPQSACASLTEIACGNGVNDCSDGDGSDLCLDGLTPGDVYYIQVASASATQLGIVRVDLEQPCSANGVGPHAEAAVADASPPAASSAGAGATAWSPFRSDDEESSVGREGHHEKPHDPYRPRPAIPPRGVVAHAGPWIRDGFASIQVNVNAMGQNIPGDAANEPSIAIDPGSPNRMVIGWRQFDSVESDFRQAGWAYSHDAGKTWTFPGAIDPLVFRTDPVIVVDAAGFFHYYSLTSDYPYARGFAYDLFTSYDGGLTWPRKTTAYGGDKGWIAIDPTAGGGVGHLYTTWNGDFSCCGDRSFARSIDDGDSFEYPLDIVVPRWGTIAVGPGREVYLAGRTFSVLKSTNAHLPDQQPIFHTVAEFDAGEHLLGAGPNPDGLLGQTWVAVDHSDGVYRGHVYALATLEVDSSGQTDVVFTRSEDGGLTWTPPGAVHPQTSDWQWFGTMSVAPRGRIDVFWNDTFPTGEVNLSELRYCYSHDAGRTWSAPVAVSPVFDTSFGWPNQQKLGDYYHSISDDAGVSLAYAATFNYEQDVYYLRVGPDLDCNGNTLDDYADVSEGRSPDCNGNLYPDECERDHDDDGTIDDCDDDLDNDGVPNAIDRCGHTPEILPVTPFGVPVWDTNENCISDLSDYWRFRNCLLGGRPGVPAPLAACHAAFDRNADAAVNLADFAQFQLEFGLSLP